MYMYMYCNVTLRRDIDALDDPFQHAEAKLAGRSNWGAVVLRCHACFSYYMCVETQKLIAPLLPFPPLPDEPSDLSSLSTFAG